MKMSYPILAGFVALAVAACERGAEKDKASTETSAQPKEGFGQLSIDEVAARVGKPGVYLIDNNPRDVWAKGHVPTATWVDYNTMTTADLPADKKATLIFYCANEH